MSEYISVDLSFEWAQPNDPLLEARSIRELASQLENLTPVLRGAREIVVSDVREHFEAEHSPGGDPWADWSPSYAPVAELKNIGKLRRRDTQDLFQAATDRMNYPVLGNDMFIDTTRFPIYWAIQQYGGLIMSGATVVRRYSKRRRNEAGASDHGRIPARPYLGMSAEAEMAVIVLFDQFISREIIGWIENPLRGPGAMQPRMRGGVFGKIPGI
jgi:phage gpG-like protein